MRIIGMMTVGSGEADKYLDKALDTLDRLCDDALICLNSADEKTKEVIHNTRFNYYEDSRTWGRQQNRIKEDLAKKLHKFNPDWILSLDADEEIMNDREHIEYLISRHDQVAWYVYIINLWNDESHHQEALGFWNVRFWNYKKAPNLNWTNRPLHCGLAPEWAYHYGKYAPIILKHYGLMDEKTRKLKVRRYNMFDPYKIYKDKWYYDWLKSDKQPQEFHYLDWINKVQDETSKHKYNSPNLNNMNKKDTEFSYIRREDGSTFDLPTRTVAETLKRHPNWQLIEKKAPEQEDTTDVFACSECDKEYSLERSLKAHVTRYHS